MAIKKSKSYLDNPALQFISTALVDEANSPLEEGPALGEAPKEPGAAAAEEAAAQAQPSAPLSPAPAGEGAAAPPPVPRKAAERRREKPEFPVPMKPMYVEVRSKRLNLLLQPSLFAKLQKIARKDGVSVNELIHRALSSYAEGRGY